MALDFNVLAQTPSIVQRFYQGREDVQREAEQNMLRQQRAMQLQQGQEDRAYQMQERAYQTQERQRATAESQRRQQAIANFSAKFAEGGYKFDRASLAELQAEAMQTRDPTLLKVAQEGFRLLDEEEEYQRAFPSAPRTAEPTAPAAAAQPEPMAAPAAPMGEPITDAETVSRARAMGNMEPRYAVTSPVSPEPVAPPVANTLAPAPVEPAAAPVNAMLAGPMVPGALPADPYATRRQELIALTGSSNKRVAARAKAELDALPKSPEAPKPAELPQDLRMMRALGLPETAEGFAQYNKLKQRPESMSQLARLIEERDALPAGSPNRALYDKAIDEKLGTEKRSIERQRMNLEQIRIDLDRARINNDQRRIAVLENQFMQQSDPAFQQRMAQAKAAGEAAGKGDVVAAAKLPIYIDKGAETIRLIDEMIGKAPKTDASGKVIERGTAPHPGFQGAVGATLLPGARLVPGTSEADFQARFEQIKGSAFLEAFEALKGGGAITEKEGEKGTQAITRMSLAQSEREFITAARDLQDIVRTAVANAQKKLRQGPASTGTTTPSAPAAGVDRSNPLLQ